MNNIAYNLRQLRQQIEATCQKVGRKAQTVDIVAVAKTFPFESINSANKAGLNTFGENYIQEAVAKYPPFFPATKHFIGRLQSNKIREIIEWADVIQTVDTLQHAQKMNTILAEKNQTQQIMIQINTTSEASKGGVTPEKVSELMQAIQDFDHLNLTGLMTIGPLNQAEAEIRASFRLLKTIFDETNHQSWLKYPLQQLSMGMSGDFEIAIEEGATMIRLGSALFGERHQV